MPRWDFNLTVVNEMDRDLKLITESISWGDFASHKYTIAKGESTKYTLYSPGGAAYGYQFNLVFQDVLPKEGDKHYGTLTVDVDVPLTKDNKSSIQTTGLLETSGWDGKLPAAGHDFSKTLSVSKKRI
ncbi:MAG: hypothetical protein LBL23_09235 [Coriobacteriales bacterium]|nr:hypothetical protein [Coriobacteriales bacterium]